MPSRLPTCIPKENIAREAGSGLIFKAQRMANAVVRRESGFSSTEISGFSRCRHGGDRNWSGVTTEQEPTVQLFLASLPSLAAEVLGSQPRMRIAQSSEESAAKHQFVIEVRLRDSRGRSADGDVRIDRLHASPLQRC